MGPAMTTATTRTKVGSTLFPLTLPGSGCPNSGYSQCTLAAASAVDCLGMGRTGHSGSGAQTLAAAEDRQVVVTHLLKSWMIALGVVVCMLRMGDPCSPRPVTRGAGCTR